MGGILSGMVGSTRAVIDNSAGATPALNEESFTRLLEAAYIMQEHQDHARQSMATAGLPQIIADIVEIQRLIQTRDLEFGAAVNLIASKLGDFTGAAGVAISQLDGNELHYVAANGAAARLAGAAISFDASSSYQCVRSGKCVRSLDTAADLRLNLELARKLGARSFLAAPIFRDGKAAGSIELLFSALNAFGEVEIRAAELMATVAAEVMTHQAEYELKKELEAERATVLFALEKLKPQLQKLAGSPVIEKPAAVKIEPELCRACGHTFVADETSCAACGASRTTGKYPGAELQSKWAALWDRQLADLEQGPSFRKNALQGEVADHKKEAPSDFDLEAEVAQLQKDLDSGDVNSANDSPAETALVPASQSPLSLDPLQDCEQVESVPVDGGTEHPTSEITPVSWIERCRTIAVTRSGDISLAVAALVCAVVLVWGLRSQPAAHTNTTAAVNTVRRRPKPKAPELSLFEKTLVALGVAVPPPPPAYMGDPNIKVWVDLQTGLYYCPGNSLYGTTAKGRYAAQSDAQQDSFEPAARKPCD